MTSVDDVERLASLARIQIPENDTARLAEEFQSVVTYISQLDELTLLSKSIPVVPTHHNIFRSDAEPYPSGTWTERVVRLFPFKRGNALSVKKIVSND